jgi:hypothetical protein
MRKSGTNVIDEGVSLVAFHSLQGSFLLGDYEGHDGPRAVRWGAAGRVRGKLEVASGPNIPHGETGCSPGARERGVPDTVVGDRVVRAYFFAPTDGNFSEIVVEALAQPLTRSGIALRSCRACRVMVFGGGCLLSIT